MRERKTSYTGRVALFISLTAHMFLLLALVWIQMTDPPEREPPPLIIELIAPEQTVRKPTFRRTAPPPTAKASTVLISEQRATAPPRRVRRVRAIYDKTPIDRLPLIAVSMENPMIPLAATSMERGRRIGREQHGAERVGKSRIGSGELLNSDERSGLQSALEIGKTDGNGARPPLPALELKSPLRMIAENLVYTQDPETPVDVVFVLDISQSMQDNIYAVAKHLEEMANFLEGRSFDFHIGIVTFHYTTWNAIMSDTIKVGRLTRDVKKVRETLRNVKCSGGEKALNALVEAALRVEFREGSTRRFVFVTDEFADGDYKAREVFGALYNGGIRVDVIGMDEPFQRALAARTGGIWIPISSLSS